MHLRPGAYNIEIRENGQTPFAQKVYVAVGQTLHCIPSYKAKARHFQARLSQQRRTGPRLLPPRKPYFVRAAGRI